MTRKKPNAAEMQRLAEIRFEKVVRARESLLDFTQLNMPDPLCPEDASRSRYEIAPHHALIAHNMEAVERGEIRRFICQMPPRGGKTEIISKQGIPWFMGRNPYRQTVLATYAQEYAEDVGRAVKGVMRLPHYSRQVFPLAHLERDSQSAKRMKTTEGGVIACVGRGGAITGRGADLLVIDDPLKDREEADSPRVRDGLWEWFWDVAYSRLMPGGRVVIVMTRWHEDDLVGRLIDPTNPYYNAEEARKWKVLTIPALMDNPDTGEKECVPFWPGRWPVEHFLSIKAQNPRGFNALYQQRPTAENGEFFRKEWFRTYTPEMLPKNLRIYAASDHAVSSRQDRDATVLVVAGVDENDDIYVLDCWWERKDTDDVVDAMLHMMKKWRPVLWWAESGHISKAIGPFLRKRMNEERVYIAIDEVVPAKDKKTRAQSINGRMSMGKVYFPANASWVSDARNELLKFPLGTHDDFVDALSYIGMGLDYASGPGRVAGAKVIAPKVGTLAWIKWAANKEEQARKRKKACGGL